MDRVEGQMNAEAARALDHVIVAVGDLQRAGDAWEALGFQVLPRMPHLVSGSANRIVQFATSYVELLGELDALRSPDYRRHYLNRLASGEGLVNVCFSSDDLEADRRAVMEAGIEAGPVASAKRPIVMPDGRTETTDSSFFYPTRPGHAFAAPFLTRHGRPETIFVPQYRRHPNTAHRIAGVTQYSPAPAQDAAFFSQLSQGSVEAIPGGVRLTLAQGVGVDILDAPTLRARYGDALPQLDQDTGGHGVGLTVAVKSLDACRAAIAAKVSAVETRAGLLVPASAATGCFLYFVEES